MNIYPFSTSPAPRDRHIHEASRGAREEPWYAAGVLGAKTNTVFCDRLTTDCVLCSLLAHRARWPLTQAVAQMPTSPSARVGSERTRGDGVRKEVGLKEERRMVHTPFRIFSSWVDLVQVQGMSARAMIGPTTRGVYEDAEPRLSNGAEMDAQ